MNDLEFKLLNLKIQLNQAIENNNMDLAKIAIQEYNEIDNQSDIVLDFIIAIVKGYYQNNSNEAYYYIVKNAKNIPEKDKKGITRLIEIKQLIRSKNNDSTMIKEIENYINKNLSAEKIFINYEDYYYMSMLIDLAFRIKRFDLIDNLQALILNQRSE